MQARTVFIAFGVVFGLGTMLASAPANAAGDLQLGGLLAEPAPVGRPGSMVLEPSAHARTMRSSGDSLGFTPRFAVGFFAPSDDQQLGTLAIRRDLSRAAEVSDESRDFAFTSALAGYEFGVTTSARVVEQAGAAPGSGQIYQMAGALSVAGLEVGAAFERTDTIGSTGEAMSANLAYDVGWGLTTRMGVQYLAPDVTTSTNVYSLGADFALRPNLTVQGGLAVSSPTIGEPSTTGLVGLRWRF